MEIVRCRDYEEMSSKAADIVCEEIGKKPDLVLGLATGSTPLGLYRELIDRNGKGKVSFKNVRTVNLDEYVGLGENDEQSYAYYMHSNLFSHIDINFDLLQFFYYNHKSRFDVRYFIICKGSFRCQNVLRFKSPALSPLLRSSSLPIPFSAASIFPNSAPKCRQK